MASTGVAAAGEESIWRILWIRTAGGRGGGWGAEGAVTAAGFGEWGSRCRVSVCGPGRAVFWGVGVAGLGGVVFGDEVYNLYIEPAMLYKHSLHAR